MIIIWTKATKANVTLHRLQALVWTKIVAIFNWVLSKLMSNCLQPWYCLHVLCCFSNQTLLVTINGKQVLKIECRVRTIMLLKMGMLKVRYRTQEICSSAIPIHALNHWKRKDNVAHHLHLVNCLSCCMAEVWLDVYWTPNHLKWHFGFLITADTSSLFQNNWCSIYYWFRNRIKKFTKPFIVHRWGCSRFWSVHWNNDVFDFVLVDLNCGYQPSNTLTFAIALCKCWESIYMMNFSEFQTLCAAAPCDTLYTWLICLPKSAFAQRRTLHVDSFKLEFPKFRQNLFRHWSWFIQFKCIVVSQSVTVISTPNRAACLFRVYLFAYVSINACKCIS